MRKSGFKLGNRGLRRNDSGSVSPSSAVPLSIMSTSSYHDLRVWQHAIKLALSVYRTTETFPKHEVYGLTQQMRRAAVSVASNVAEGKGRNTDKEFRQFLFTARGSLLELETQILIARELQYLQSDACGVLREQTKQVGRSLAGLLNSLAPMQHRGIA